MAKQNKTAKIIAIACDQGHYGLAYCSNCTKTLSEPYHEYKRCPFCNCVFVKTKKKIPYPYGGSDFD